MQLQTDGTTQAANHQANNQAARAEAPLPTSSSHPTTECEVNDCTMQGTRRRLGGTFLGTFCRVHYHERLKALVWDADREMCKRRVATV